MPLRDMSEPSLSPAAEALGNTLAAEWRNPQESGQPIILISRKGKPGGTHVRVVWDDWRNLTQQERSEIIMDVYEMIHGQEESLSVTVAMGLTTEEADRMHIPYQEPKS